MRLMRAPVRLKELSLDEPRIDRQHERVVEALQDLSAAIDLGRPHAETQRLLDAFAGTVQWHFSAENALMQWSAYPEAGAHIAEHRRLLEQIAAVQSEFAAGKIQSCGALELFARVWTTEHIQGADRRLAEHLRAIEARPVQEAKPQPQSVV
jgi:hemerythrin-like metal-binding protein